jgi:uncharacterized protein (TIGR02246 family)
MMAQALRIIVLLVVATAALAANGGAATPGERTESARAVCDDFVDAWNSHDMAAFAALYAEDADFVNVLGVWLQGRAAIREHHAAIHASRMKTSRLTALETEVRFLRPDVALVHVHWELTGQIGPDGAALPTRQGILSHVVAKTGGKWLITSSQNTDIAAMPSAPTSH